MSGGVGGAADEVVEVEGDGSQDPRQDDAVEAKPRSCPSRREGVGEDMVVEGVAAENEQHHVPPAGVGGRLRVEDDWDQALDVLNAPGLVM